MKMMKVMLLAAVLVSSATAAFAGTMTFGIGGGVASPSGDFGDGFKMGFNGNVYGDYWVKPTYAIGVDVDGSFFKGKEDAIDLLKAAFPAYPDPSVSATLIGFGVHGVFAFPMQDAPVQPWLTAGVGMYNGKFTIKDSSPLVNEDSSDTKVGFHVGGGVDFKGSDAMKVGADVKYHSISTDDGSTSYITAGLHLTFATTGSSK